ncbi:DNA alkylation repair protein [Sphingosinicella terrae]|uniref:DNA alkylation repair protein n=1 Tax=Sphingosinicella terrae TaxID=2172047 RepID=UPI000E0CF6D2|nr:DNA alkylation repair protein [Sphingosinicella terrae]
MSGAATVGKTASTAAEPRVGDALASLEALGSAAVREGMARYGIVASRAFGVGVGEIRRLAKASGRDQALAEALWHTGWYEARLLAVFVADPTKVTPELMDRWAADFENWADCDTACFDLFDRTRHAFAAVDRWAGDPREFVRRAAFALLASLALHDKKCEDGPFRERLALIEAAADDPRNFVKKGVSWALRAIGRRKSAALQGEARRLAERLAGSGDRTARWIGKDALRDFDKAAAARG